MRADPPPHPRIYPSPSNNFRTKEGRLSAKTLPVNDWLSDFATNSIFAKAPDSQQHFDVWSFPSHLNPANQHFDRLRLIRGRRYSRLKKPAHGREGRIFGEEKTSAPKTAQKLANEHNVTERTIRSDGKFYEQVEQLKEKYPEEAPGRDRCKSVCADRSK